MAVRGAESKAILTNAMLKIFKGAFIAPDNKTIRIPIVENGEVVEVKVSLTAAKDTLGGVGAVEAPVKDLPKFAAEGPNAQELEELKTLMKSLGLEVIE